MARPPLPLGTPGTITVTEESPGAWVARCRFRVVVAAPTHGTLGGRASGSELSR